MYPDLCFIFKSAVIYLTSKVTRKHLKYWHKNHFMSVQHLLMRGLLLLNAPHIRLVWM